MHLRPHCTAVIICKYTGIPKGSHFKPCLQNARPFIVNGFKLFPQFSLKILGTMWLDQSQQ